MKLQQFIQEQRDHLVAFEKHWQEQVEAGTEGYPEEMLAGDWDEQLMMFSEECE